MGRLRKGIWVFNDASGEYDSPGIDGRTIKYRDVLVDWLNRALSGSPGDRHAAERVGTLIKKMNESAVEYLEAVEAWKDEGSPGAVPACKTFREIASAFDYELELDLCPRPGFKKWHLAFQCVTCPSGDAYDRWGIIDDKWPDEGPLHQKWPEVPRHFNPECQAVNAVIYVALEGRLGTIKQCQVERCEQWFAATDDERRRFCAKHDSDDARRGTQLRRKQLAAAQKRVRENAKAEDERQRSKLRASGFITPGRRRAKGKTKRP